MSTPYHLTIEERPTYLHARVVGERTPQNALRFLREVHEACVQRGRSAALLEMNLSGPSLDVASVFQVISQRSPEGTALSRIAYVDTSASGPAMAKFAETVAVNRGVNVRLFNDLAGAVQWMSDDPGPGRAGR